MANMEKVRPIQECERHLPRGIIDLPLSHFVVGRSRGKEKMGDNKKMPLPVVYTV